MIDDQGGVILLGGLVLIILAALLKPFQPRK